MEPLPRRMGYHVCMLGMCTLSGLAMRSTPQLGNATAGDPMPSKQLNQVLISSRFGQYPEPLARELFVELKRMGLNPRMTTPVIGDDYGMETITHLERSKAMIIMASDNYGEVTSPYCTFFELKYAYEHGLSLLPVQLSSVFPPEPPGNPLGAELCRWALGPSLKRVDWSGKTWNARAVALELKPGILEAFKMKAERFPYSAKTVKFKRSGEMIEAS